MGVKSCSRSGCRSIMCDCYVPSIGYLCFGCIDEFKKVVGLVYREEEIIEKLEVFIDLEKDDSPEGIDIDEFLKQYID